MNRYTFVVQVYPDGISMVENLRTSERVRIPDVAAVSPQIERWLVDLPDPRSGIGDSLSPRRAGVSSPHGTSH